MIKMKKDSTTIRIDTETKYQLDDLKGELSYNKMLLELIDFYLNKK